MAACDYSQCMDEEGRRQRGCSKHRLCSASPHATAGGRRQDPREHSQGCQGGTQPAEVGYPAAPSPWQLAQEGARILPYLNKMTELNKWRADTELRKPGCSQSRFFKGEERRQVMRAVRR